MIAFLGRVILVIEDCFYILWFFKQPSFIIIGLLFSIYIFVGTLKIIQSFLSSCFTQEVAYSLNLASLPFSTAGDPEQFVPLSFFFLAISLLL